MSIQRKVLSLPRRFHAPPQQPIAYSQQPNRPQGDGAPPVELRHVPLSSELACNNELTWFVGGAAILFSRSLYSCHRSYDMRSLSKIINLLHLLNQNRIRNFDLVKRSTIYKRMQNIAHQKYIVQCLQKLGIYFSGGFSIIFSMYWVS